MKIKKLENLTPHAINIVVEGKEIKIAPNGKVARCSEHIEKIDELEYDDGFRIPVVEKMLGEVEDLPEPDDGKIFIVSLAVAQAANRKDVLAIGEIIRDGKGQVIGAKSLSLVK